MRRPKVSWGAKEYARDAYRLLQQNEAMMPYGKTLGFKVESIAAGEAVVSLACSTDLHNVFGYTHGGAIFSIADTAVGLAHLSSIAQGQTATTIASSISYMRPALYGTLRATARNVKQGRTLSFYECTIADESGQLVARVSATMMTLDEKQSRGRNELYGFDAVRAGVA
jgi:acyl-CoA thioesterase